MVAEPLRNANYDVRTVVDLGWGGTPDSELLPKVVDEGAFFITADKGFGDIREYPPGSHAGILVLRPASESIAEYAQLLKQFLVEHRIEDLRRATAVLTSVGIPIRRPSDD